MQYGKFNSAEELLKSYNQLERSFTQKCQELSAAKKALESNADIFSQRDSGTSEVSPPLNCELQSNANGTSLNVRDTKSVVQTIERQADLSQTVKDSASVNALRQDGGKDSAAAETVYVVPADEEPSAVNGSPSQSVLTAETVKQYLDANPDVRAALLNGLPSQTTPLPRVMASGGNVSLVLPNKPRTIREASELAKAMFGK